MSKHPNARKVLQHIDFDQIIRTCRPLIGDQRWQKLQQTADQRMGSIHLVLENPYDLHNAVACVRSAEVFGLLHIHIITTQPAAEHAKKISQSSIYWVQCHYHPDLATCLAALPKTAHLAGATVDATQTLAEVTVDRPLVLFFGNEHAGLSEAAKNNCHQLFSIPMTGFTESLNLSVSVGISLYDITQRRRQHCGTKEDISPDEKQQLMATYTLNSVSYRSLPGLFPEAFIKQSP